MYPLYRNEFLSLLDRNHIYRPLLHSLSFPYSLTYLVLVSLHLPPSGWGELPLSKLNYYFSKSSQIANRNDLVKIGVLSTSRAKQTSPTIVARRSLLLAPSFQKQGRGAVLLEAGDLNFIKLLKKSDKLIDNQRKSTINIKRLPRKWCRSLILDLLYRCYAESNVVNQGQREFASFVSRCTQWRGRHLLAQVGRIRRDWINRGRGQNTLEITLEPSPGLPGAATRHPFDRRSLREPQKQFPKTRS